MQREHRDDPVTAARLCDDGYLALEAGRFDEAHALLTRASELEPDTPLIRYRLGLLYMDTGRLAEALAEFDRVIRRQPDDVRAHNNRGAVLQRLGNDVAAEAAFVRALELGPEHPQPYLNLGNLLEKQGRAQDAIRLYERAIARGLDAGIFGHHAAAASGRVTERAPDPWVRETFDNFAPTFDAHLRGLGYNVPDALAKLLHPRVAGGADILDLGCGTGQTGSALASVRRRLVGVDLAPKMLDLARARGVYDDLACAEAHEWLRRAADASFDIVTATDVLIYIGKVDDLFREVARVLRNGGWFGFSTEECDTGDYTLRGTGRYAQAQAYVERVAAVDFAIAAAVPSIIRVESGTPVSGRLYVLQRR
jgi:predicted TPR repeat methyltransferase